MGLSAGSNPSVSPFAIEVHFLQRRSSAGRAIWVLENPSAVDVLKHPLHHTMVVLLGAVAGATGGVRITAGGGRAGGAAGALTRAPLPTLGAIVTKASVAGGAVAEGQRSAAIAQQDVHFLR